MSDGYILNIGCHKNTLMSRDSERRTFNTEREAIQSYQDSKGFWKSIGYVVWFAELVKPDGSKTMLEQNPYH